MFVDEFMIKSFYFQSAKYLISDEFGNQLLLENNYRDRSYRMVILRKKTSAIVKLQQRLNWVATDLLSRKHGVNFAYKFKLY